MAKGDPNPTGGIGWYIDSDGNGHNVPIQVDQYGNVIMSGTVVVDESTLAKDATLQLLTTLIDNGALKVLQGD